MASIEEVTFHKVLELFESDKTGNERALIFYEILYGYREKIETLAKYQAMQQCVDRIQELRDSTI